MAPDAAQLLWSAVAGIFVPILWAVLTALGLDVKDRSAQWAVVLLSFVFAVLAELVAGGLKSWPDLITNGLMVVGLSQIIFRQLIKQDPLPGTTPGLGQSPGPK